MRSRSLARSFRLQQKIASRPSSPDHSLCAVFSIPPLVKQIDSANLCSREWKKTHQKHKTTEQREVFFSESNFSFFFLGQGPRRRRRRRHHRRFSDTRFFFLRLLLFSKFTLETMSSWSATCALQLAQPYTRAPSSKRENGRPMSFIQSVENNWGKKRKKRSNRKKKDRRVFFRV